jgi:hypothetical protein
MADRGLLSLNTSSKGFKGLRGGLLSLDKVLSFPLDPPPEQDIQTPRKEGDRGPDAEEH